MIGFTLNASVLAPKPRAAVAEPNAPTLTGEPAAPMAAPRMVRFGFGSHSTKATDLLTAANDDGNGPKGAVK